MNSIKIDGRRAKRVASLSAEKARLHDLLAESSDPKVADIEGGAELTRSLEREYESVNAELLRELEAAAGAAGGAVLARGQSMRDAIPAADTDVSLGRLIRGLGTGDWRGTSNDVKSLVLSGGAGAAIPGSVTAGIVDLAREQSCLFRAGAQLMPIEAPSAKVARMTSAPAVEWAPESVSPAERDLTDGAWVFDAVELTAATAWLYTTLTIEALEDVVDLEAAVMNDFARQFALIFDESGIAGDGDDKPLGIALMDTDDDRVLELPDAGALVDYVPFVRAMGALKAAHHEPTSVLLTPGVWTELACLQDKDFNPMQPPSAYQQMNEFVSSFLPTDGGVGKDKHTAVVGDLSAMTFGVRTDATLEVSRLGAGFKKGAVEVRGYIRLGMYLTRPEAICILRGISLPDES